MSTYRKTLLIDLDGVLNEYNGKFDENEIPNIKKGAKEFLENLSQKYEMKIFTTRNQLLASKFRTRSFAEYKKRVYEKYIKEKLPNLPIKICSEYQITVERIRDTAKKSESCIILLQETAINRLMTIFQENCSCSFACNSTRFLFSSHYNK